MPSNRPKHDREFKINAVKYVDEHPDLTLEQCTKNLGVGTSTISRWKNQYQKNGKNIDLGHFEHLPFLLYFVVVYKIKDNVIGELLQGVPLF